MKIINQIQTSAPEKASFKEGIGDVFTICWPPYFCVDANRPNIHYIAVERQGRRELMLLSHLIQIPKFAQNIFRDFPINRQLAAASTVEDAFDFLKKRPLRTVGVDQLAYSYGDKTFLKKTYFYEFL